MVGRDERERGRPKRGLRCEENQREERKDNEMLYMKETRVEVHGQKE
jgi:hypothetical protein